MSFYEERDLQAEQICMLHSLIQRWENEIVEFKEASGQYPTDRIGQYFSAISNEANLKNQRFGWLVLGVSENGEKSIVGTNFKKGNPELLEKFKYEIARDTTDGITFSDIIELEPIVDGKKRRVLMFQIPAAAVGIPTSWKNRNYARSGESLMILPQNKVDIIRSQERIDWSKRIIDGVDIECLDKNAIAFAREKYVEKMNRPHIAEEVESMTDEQFLLKTKMIINGKITNAAMVLLGNSDYDYLFERAPKLMWRLFGSDGQVKDYTEFTIPFITVVDKIFEKIRILKYRYMPNQMSLFPKETDQYDSWLLRELLNNCIAHSNYQLGGRIYFNEFEDCITISNPGDFLPRSIESVLKPAYNPPFYRNQLLADAMVKFHMIDTATSGIKKVFRIQKEKFFPMPDYDLSQNSQVVVKVYGKTLDEKYTYMLYDNPELDIETVYLLDQVQKGKGKLLSDDAVNFLRKHKLVEGRKTSLYLSARVAASLSEETEYIKNRGFSDEYYRNMIISYLKQFQRANRKKIVDLLWDKLPDSLTYEQKKHKITTLLTYMRKKGIIETDSKNHQKSYWVLVKK